MKSTLQGLLKRKCAPLNWRYGLDIISNGLSHTFKLAKCAPTPVQFHISMLFSAKFLPIMCFCPKFRGCRPPMENLWSATTFCCFSLDLEYLVYSRVLLEHQLDALSRRLSKTNINNLAVQLNISTQVVDASFCYFCTDSISTEKAIHHVLTNWLNRQNNRKEAYLKLGETLTHPDV